MCLSALQPGKQKKKFSSFFKSLVIELDKDLYGPDNHLVEVSSNTAGAVCLQRKRVIIRSTHPLSDQCLICSYQVITDILALVMTMSGSTQINSTFKCHQLGIFTCFGSCFFISDLILGTLHNKTHFYFNKIDLS